MIAYLVSVVLIIPTDTDYNRLF